MKKFAMTITYQDRLWLFFLAGTIGGTVAANLLSSELQSQIGYFNTLFLSGQTLSAQEKQELWLFVARQRCLEVLGGWLISMTVFSVPGYYMIAGMMGGSSAIALSVITGQKGIMGIFFYLASILPQACFYVAVWLILASWAGESSHVVRLRAIGILLLLTVAGAAAEVYLNPILLNIFQNI